MAANKERSRNKNYSTTSGENDATAAIFSSQLLTNCSFSFAVFVVVAVRPVHDDVGNEELLGVCQYRLPVSCRYRCAGDELSM